MRTKLIIELYIKPLLIKHYKQVYENYMNASIKDDNFELGQILECEYIMLKYFDFNIKELFNAQEAVRNGKKRTGNSMPNKN